MTILYGIRGNIILSFNQFQTKSAKLLPEMNKHMECEENYPSS